MLKLIIVGQRAQGLMRSAAQRHLREVHGPMVINPPAGAGEMPSGYVQNHVMSGAYPVGEGAHSIERDLVTELWFEDFAHLKASTSTPYYKNYLQPDEPNFVDQATVERLLCDVSQVDNPPAAAFKAFLFLSVNDRAQLDMVSESALAWMAVASGCVHAICNVPRRSADGMPPFADLIVEGWFAAAADAIETVGKFDNSICALAAHGIALPRCLAMSAEEYSAARLASLKN